MFFMSSHIVSFTNMHIEQAVELGRDWMNASTIDVAALEKRYQEVENGELHTWNLVTSRLDPLF